VGPGLPVLAGRTGKLAAESFHPSGQEDLAPSGAVSRVRANIAALATLRTIQHDGRAASPEEQRVLARWSGWGAVPEVFDETRPEYAWARDQLARLLSAEETGAAARNTLNAHYTDAGIVHAIWSAVQALGFAEGKVLEPGAGSFPCVEVSHGLEWLSLKAARGGRVVVDERFAAGL
jgi:hypothetical protein